MQILDSTLREGEQTPGVSFSLEEKINIAKLLDRFGVDIIEVGHPCVSQDVRVACEALAEENLQAATLCHARALREDIEDAKSVGSPWVGIFLGTSPLSLEHKLHLTKEEALKKISESIKYAKDLGLKVRFTPEDTTRTEPDYLAQALEVAQQAGADRISIADTVGTALPNQILSLVREVKGQVDIPIHVHCHNDYGMAVANALAGFEAGAFLIDVTVNGLGERTGITPLAPLVVALKRLYGVENEWRLGLLPELSRLVEKASGIFNSEQSPIVGEHAFSHKAGLHTKAVLENPRTYEAIPPEIVHKQRKIIIDKYTGKAAVKNRLNEMGIDPSDQELDRIVNQVKEKAGKGRFTDIDLLEIADEILELEVRSRVPLKVEAVVSLTLNSASYTTRITRRVAALHEVDQVYEITGESDILAHVETGSVQDLNEIIEEFRVMDGVKKTTTSIILKGYDRVDKSK